MQLAEWQAIARAASLQHDWEEVALAAAPVLPTRREASPAAVLPEEMTVVFAKAAACMWKGIAEVTNAAWEMLVRCEFVPYELVVCCGPGVSLAALASALDCQRLLLLDLDVLEPFLERVRGLAPTPPEVVHLAGAQLWRSGALHTTGHRPSLVLLDVCPTGLTPSQCEQARAVLSAEGGAVRFCPRVVEVWAMAVQGHCDDGVEGSDDDGKGSTVPRAALGRLLRVSSPLCPAGSRSSAIRFAPMSGGGEEGGSVGIPLQLGAWEHAELCCPVLLWRWSAAVSEPSGSDADLTVEVRALTAGQVDAVVVWAEIDIGVAEEAEGGGLGPPPPTREPHRAFSVAPLAVAAGERFRIHAERGGAHGVAVRCVERIAAASARCSSGGGGGGGGDGEVGGGEAGSRRTPAAPPTLLPARGLPAWTAFMLNDVERAAAYEEALHRVMRRLALSRRHVCVVDLGAGAGLLSLLAARAAAAAGLRADIYAIERVPELASLCRGLFQTNGAPAGIVLHTIVADSMSVRVATTASTGMDDDGGGRARNGPRAPLPDGLPNGLPDGLPADGMGGHHPSSLESGRGQGSGIGQPSSGGTELPHRAQLIVSEIFGDDALAEGVLPSFRHATAELLDRTCGVTIPAQLTVQAALAALPPSVDDAASLREEIAQLGDGLMGSVALGRAGIDLRPGRMDAYACVDLPATVASVASASGRHGCGERPASHAELAADVHDDMPVTGSSSATGSGSTIPPSSLLTDALDLCTIALDAPPPRRLPGMYACMYACLPGEPWPLLVGHVPLMHVCMHACMYACQVSPGLCSSATSPSTQRCFERALQAACPRQS